MSTYIGRSNRHNALVEFEVSDTKVEEKLHRDEWHKTLELTPQNNLVYTWEHTLGTGYVVLPEHAILGIIELYKVLTTHKGESFPNVLVFSPEEEDT